jgi:forespore regulator of the sigma-K checkpoint
MNLSSLVKQLKKRLRLRRRWLSLGLFLIAAGACAVWLAYDSQSPFSESEQNTKAVSASNTEPAPDPDEQVLNQIRHSAQKKEAEIRKTYVCGEETEQLGLLSPDEIVQLHAEHPQWTVTLQQEKVVFNEQIEDLSQACKDNAYIGLDKNGSLSLFDGLPREEKVLRTFFQLNMGYLESSLPRETVNQLKEGIRVSDLSEYNSVLSTFSDFAVEDSEKVMKPDN